MTDLLSLGADIQWPDHDRAAAVRDSLTDPALGNLTAVAEWVAGVHPVGETFTAVRAIVIGAEPGATVAAAADSAGVEIHVITDLPHGEAEAVEAGAALANAQADRGTDLLIVAAPDLGDDAAVAVSVLTNTEPVKVLSRGSAATDPDAWMQRATLVRDGRRVAIAYRDDADRLLETIDSPRLTVTAALVLQAAARGIPVVLDGPVAAAAALVACLAQARAVRWWCAADVGPDALHELALTRLGQHGLLGLGTGLGDGLAGILAVPLLQAAARLGS